MRGYLVERDGLPRACFADESEARAYAEQCGGTVREMDAQIARAPAQSEESQ